MNKIIFPLEPHMRGAGVADLQEGLRLCLGDGVFQLSDAERQAFLDAVPDNANRGRSTGEPNVYSVGKCAVYTVLVTTTQDPDGTPKPGRFWNTRLFIHEHGQWLCSAWQVMKICSV